MSEGLFYRGDEPVPVPPSKAIQDEPPRTAPRAAAESAIVEMQYVNRSRNSRIGVSLTASPWSVRWKSPLAGSLQPPTVILSSGDRILVYGDMSWELFDTNGKALGQAALGTGGVTVDPQWKLFYFPDKFGLISAHSLDDAKPAYSLLLLQTKAMFRRLMARNANSLLTVGYQLPVDAHQSAPEYSIAELTDLRGPDNRKSWSDEGGPALTQELVAHDSRLLPAMRANTLALAADNNLAMVDAASLQPQAVFTGTFRPLSLSLDELRRVYLVVSIDNQNALWQISPAGGRLYSCSLPPGFAGSAAPPAVGYDHTVYLYRGRFLLSVARDGKLNWSREAPTVITGGIVTADDQFVTTEGSQIAAWNVKGERRILLTANEPLVTTPVLTASGLLFAASRTQLHCFGR